MKERPILFSAPMVRAILDGSKTQTRRVVKPQPPSECSIHYMLGDESWLPEDERTPLRHNWEAWHGPLFENRPPRHMAGMHSARCPYGKPGDRLWVRESLRFVAVGDNHHHHAVYAADNARVRRCPDLADWACDGLAFNCARSVPSIHMPRWASRILLELTGVRVERLQDISEADCLAEGAPPHPSGRPQDAFACLWRSVNGDGSWVSNPWAWVIELKRVMPCP